ncbi:MAG: pentapeptide repeat-containing protein [Rhodospirillaceae bacterium]|nr:pentapeptide repeat-containing protein [Rhodospirillaceae bacterium]
MRKIIKLGIELTTEEIRRILDAHQSWLRSDGSKGVRAEFGKADLHDVNFVDADLQDAGLRKTNLKNAQLFGTNLAWANLQKANLENADLTDANLSGAELKKADLRDAKLINADLANANLTGANLTGADLSRVKGLEAAKLNNIDLTDATGLVGNEFAGADITGAKMPENISRFDGLNYVETASRQARNVFLAMVGGCIYSWLTIWTTTDAELVINDAMTHLPIIQADVPIVGFFWVAPLILLALYFYFHLYLQGLWEALARLPAIFPDGSPVDQRCYPWLLMSLARAHVPKLELDQPPLWWMRVGLSLFAAWCLVPMTLFFLWLRYLPRHDSFGVIVLIASLLAAVWSGVFFYHSMRAAFRRIDVKYRGRFLVSEIIGVCLVAVMTVPLSFAVIGGGKHIKIFGYGLYAELTKEKFLGAEIEGINLQHAEAITAVLTKADLEGANLQGANLQGALLEHVNLKNSNLRRANLKKADLYGVNLKWADLSHANLSGANLTNAKLTGANLKGANLSNACLHGANLKGVILEETNLRKAQLTGARLDGSNLKSANLTGAVLKNARFDRDKSWWKFPGNPEPQGVEKHAVNMWGVILSGADLTGTNLSKTQGLTVAQFEDVCGLGSTLPKGIQVHVKLPDCTKAKELAALAEPPRLSVARCGLEKSTP